jgi:glyoxylase I family protein
MNEERKGSINSRPRCRVHSIAVQTGHFDRALHFYTELLGFPIVREPYNFKGKRDLTWLDAGRCLLELYSVKKGIEPEPWSERMVGTVHLAFEVDDLDSMLTWLRESGIHILREPFIPPTGDPYQARCAFIRGPDDEEILLREPARKGALVP